MTILNTHTSLNSDQLLPVLLVLQDPLPHPIPTGREAKGRDCGCLLLRGTGIGRGPCHCPSKQGQALDREAGGEGATESSWDRDSTQTVAAKPRLRFSTSIFVSPCTLHYLLFPCPFYFLLHFPLFIFTDFSIVLLKSSVSFKIFSLRKSGNY